MQIDVGNVIASVVIFLSAFAGAIVYASNAHSKADSANSKVDAINEQIIDLRARHDALDSKIVEKLSAIESTLSWIQGHLNVDISNK